MADNLPKQSGGEPVPPIEDNRPWVVAQRKLKGGTALDPTSDALNPTGRASGAAAMPNNTGLPDQLKTGVESLSGISLDNVKVHYNSAQPAQLNALAYAQGNQIHVGPGQEGHLPHEAWHVVQQAQGRVRETTQMKGVGINGDQGLEKEADVMGARALEVEATNGPSDGETIRRSLSDSQAIGTNPSMGQAKSPQQAVTQLAAPGGIEHAMSSCFAASLINTFAVVAPLRNLLNPANNPLPAGNVQNLQGLLWRCVNTVDATQIVTRNVVKLVMASLAQNNIIQNAADTADFSQVMAGVVEAFRQGQHHDGQANLMPVSSGEVAWFPGEALEESVSKTINQIQDDEGDYNLAPNSVHVTRGDGNGGLAPKTFRIYTANDTVVTYRLKSIIERTGKYVGGHFISHVDRGGDGPEEWHKSDDLHPNNVEAIANIGTHQDNMQRNGYAYIYERINIPIIAPTFSLALSPLATHTLQALYEQHIDLYIEKEKGSGYISQIFDMGIVGDKEKDKEKDKDIHKYDKTLHVKKDEDKFISKENVGGKIKEFNHCKDQEAQEVWKVNTLLKAYSAMPTLDVHDRLQQQIPEARIKIGLFHQRQAQLITHFMNGVSNVEAKRSFLQGIIPKFEETDPELVESILSRLDKFNSDQMDEEFTLLKGRLLTYVIQGLGTVTGKARLKEFGGLLGDKRRIGLGTTAIEMGAGLADQDDEAFAHKQDGRNQKEDGERIATLKDNIPAFIDQRFGKEAPRTPNPQKDKVGNLMVLLDRDKKLFPVYIGQTDKGNVEMFSSPLFTAMHHETGHAVNFLKGMGGGGNKYKWDKNTLIHLTDEEEVHNISLDQHSDKAMSRELGLPHRIAHKSYLGFDYSQEEIQVESEYHGELQKWKGLSGQDKEKSNPIRDLQLEVKGISIASQQFHSDIARALNNIMPVTSEWAIKEEEPNSPQHEANQRVADALGWCLDQLEHKVYDRMSAIQRNKTAMVKPGESEFAALKNDLDLIQAQHRKYISAIIGSKLQLWVNGTVDEKRMANKDWADLLRNKKGIRIEESASPTFQNEARSNVARLLSRGNGRKLVHALMSTSHALTIRTPQEDKVEKIRKYYIQEGLQGTKLEEELKGLFGGQAGPVDHKSSQVKETDKGLERNEGSYSTMSMLNGLKDSERHSLDNKGRLLLSPNFIEMGHEMIHALHNIRGSSLAAIAKDTDKDTAWENKSERSVIEGTPQIKGLLDQDFITENMLREDHNLGVRYGHNTLQSTKDGIQRSLWDIAQDESWDKMGGPLNDKTPDGIMELRKALAVKPFDIKGLASIVNERAERWGITRVLLAVPSKATEFYKLVKAYCDLLSQKQQPDITVLQQFLHQVSRFTFK